MSIFKKIVKGVGKAALEAASQSASQSRKAMHQKAQLEKKNIAGKTIDEWDAMWVSVGVLSQINLTAYNRYVGLYRASLNGRVVYIGRAIEYNNGGFRKRLSDYTRSSDSARKHGSGQKMYQHRDELKMDFLIVGTDENAAKVTKVLEGLMVGKYDPEWNKVRNFSL